MLFDEEFRRQLEVLKRLVARALAGRGGSGRSPLLGRGGRVEFAEHRPYAQGDEVATIDWNAYARLEALVVKEFLAPKEAQLLLVLDRSGSMQFGGKDETALRTAAALAWLALSSGARVACTAAGGASRWIDAPERFPELLDAMERTPAGGAADLPKAVERAPAGGTGKKTSIVFSDFYEAAPAARAIASLGRRAGTVLCAHVLSPEELRPPRERALVLQDLETRESLPLVVTPAVAERFRRAAESFLRERRELFARHGAYEVRLTPGEDLVAAVERVVVGGVAA